MWYIAGRFPVEEMPNYLSPHVIWEKAKKG